MHCFFDSDSEVRKSSIQNFGRLFRLLGG